MIKGDIYIGDNNTRRNSLDRQKKKKTMMIKGDIYIEENDTGEELRREQKRGKKYDDD